MAKLFVTLLLLLSVSNSQAANIDVLESCNAPTLLPSLYTVLNSGRNTLGGWSHIRTEEPNGEYDALALDDTDYEVSQNNYRLDKGCDGEKVQNAILVAKLSDWTRQHSNGFETILDTESVTFGELSHVMMDIRINSVGTRILDKHALKKRYYSYLTPEQFEEFDRGKVNLGITLFEKGALDQSTESFNLETFIEIDQTRYADKWLRILIPLSEFHAYTEKEYQGVTRSLNDFKKTMVNGFRINPENSHGKQLRNFLGDDWSADIPETFKEMSISLRRIEFLSVRTGEL